MNQVGRRYRVLEPVGRGSFGTVYRAELIGEGGFSKMVALKILNADIDEMGEVASRLRDEARVLGLVRHRAIVQVDGLVKLEGRWAVVMEYVEGVDLRRLLAETRKIPAGPALEVSGEVASALHVAYNGLGPDGKALRLLHRDIKPSNIQITTHGETKVLDFGVARADFETREAETKSLVFGSIGYMSPERLDFIDGPEGDIYALGAVLYETLTGQRFGKTSGKESRHRARLLEALDMVWDATSGQSEELVRLIESMMAYEPADRPTSRDVERRCAALRRELGGELFRDWAEQFIPPIIAAERRAVEEERNDVPVNEAVLNEQVSAEPGTLSRLVPSAPSSSRRSSEEVPMRRRDAAVQDATEDGEDESESGTDHGGTLHPGTELPDDPALDDGAEDQPTAQEGVLPPIADEAKSQLRLYIAAAGVAALAIGLFMGHELGIGKTDPPLGALDPVATTDPAVTTTPASEEPGAANPSVVEGDPEAKPPEANPAEVEAPTEVVDVAADGEVGEVVEVPAETAPAATVQPPPPETKTPVRRKPPKRTTRTPAPAPVVAAPAPPTTGTMRVTGDAVKVVLVNKATGQSHAAGSNLPEGTYEVRATFANQPSAIVAGIVSVKAGAVSTLRCDAAFSRCGAE